MGGEKRSEVEGPREVYLGGVRRANKNAHRSARVPAAQGGKS